MNDWIKGKPFKCTAEHLTLRWGCGGRGEKFRCALCGYKFKIGDTLRWQFTNDVRGAGGNPFVCQSCDTGKESIVAEILKRRAIINSDQWWWFIPRKV